MSSPPPPWESHPSLEDEGFMESTPTPRRTPGPSTS